jgi:hypothetical protein
VLGGFDLSGDEEQLFDEHIEAVSKRLRQTNVSEVFDRQA